MALRHEADNYYQAKVLIKMADALNAQGDHEKAGRSLNRAVTLLHQVKDTSSSHRLYVACRQLGEAYIKLGRNEEAVSALEREINIEKNAEKCGHSLKKSQSP